MTIPDAAVQAALDVLYRYETWQDDFGSWVAASKSNKHDCCERSDRSDCDRWLLEKVLAAAFPVMLRDAAAGVEARKLTFASEGLATFLRMMADNHGGAR